MRLFQELQKYMVFASDDYIGLILFIYFFLHLGSILAYLNNIGCWKSFSSLYCGGKEKVVLLLGFGLL